MREKYATGQKCGLLEFSFCDFVFPFLVKTGDGKRKRDIREIAKSVNGGFIHYIIGREEKGTRNF